MLSPANRIMIPAHPGRLLLFLCCLFSLLSVMSARAQMPAAQMVWHDSAYLGPIAYSPTQSLIAVAEGFGDCSLIDPDGTVVQTIHCGQGNVNALAFSPDGSTLATGGGTSNCIDGQWVYSGSIKLWSVSSGACQQTITESYEVMSVAYSADGQMLVSGDDDGHIKIWDISNGACLQTVSEDYSVYSVAFAPDGLTVASSNGSNISLWKVSNGACLQTFTGHAYGVLQVAFSPDGQTLASASEDYTVKLWQVSNGACLKTISPGEGWVNSVAFSPDGNTLAFGCWDRTLESLERESERCKLRHPCRDTHPTEWRYILRRLCTEWKNAGHQQL